MNKLIMTGSIVVAVALIFYTLALVTEVRKRTLTQRLLTLFSLGLLFDITATCFMISGSPNSPFTLHGFIGYSALIAMVVEVVLLLRLKSSGSKNSVLPLKLHRYTVFAYCWWVLAFITGGLLAAMS